MATDRFTVRFGGLTLTGEWNGTPAARKLAESLPLRSRVQVWGEEIYFDTGIELRSALGDRGVETVSVGDVAYWPPGRALCLFWGPTPISGPDEIRPASEVLLVGRLAGDPQSLREAVGTRQVTVESAGSDESPV